MTTLLEDQTKAANQGKPGYDALGNSIAQSASQSGANAQVQANQTAAAKLGLSIPGIGGGNNLNQSTTTLSSDKSKDIANIQTATNNYAKTGITTDPATGLSTYANGTIYNPTQDKSEVTTQTGGYNGDTYVPPGSPTPKDVNGNDITLTELPPSAQANVDGYRALMEKSDANTASMVAAVQAQYEQLIKQQTQANTANEAGTSKLLLRNGGLQHTASGGDVLHAQVSYGLQQLGALNAQEQMAIAQAQQAGLDNDFKLQGAINDQIEQIRKEKTTILQKQAQDLADANKKAAEATIQASRDSAIGGLLMQGVTDPNQMIQLLNYDDQGNQVGDFSAKEIQDTLATLNPDKASIQKLAQTLGENGADPNLIQKVLGAGNLSAAIAMAGSSLQDPKLQLQLQGLQLDNELAKANIAKAKKETALLGEPTPAEKKATTAALKEAQASLPVMQDKIDAVDILKSASGLDSRVGTSIFSRSPMGITGVVGKILGPGILGLPGDLVAKATGSGQEFAGGVHKLVNGLTLQNLIDAKARGATFGALSEGELNLLSSSASAINDWEVKDKNGVGQGYWNIDEASFKKELDNIKALTQRAITQSQGTIFSPDETSLLDNVYAPSTMTTPDMYFNN